MGPVQGIEAQTMQQFNAAMEADLHIIPVLNKAMIPPPHGTVHPGAAQGCPSPHTRTPILVQP